MTGLVSFREVVQPKKAAADAPVARRRDWRMCMASIAKNGERGWRGEPAVLVCGSACTERVRRG